MDKISYAIGLSMGQNLMGSGVIYPIGYNTDGFIRIYTR